MTGTTYAQRTARYAYSAVGDRHADILAKYQQQWARLEDREPTFRRQQEQAKECKPKLERSAPTYYEPLAIVAQ